MRPAIGLPIAMSVPAPSRLSSAASRRLQHHEQARAGGPRQRRQAPMQLGRNRRTRPCRRDGSTPPAAAGRPAARSGPAGRPARSSRTQAAATARFGIALLAQRRPLPQRVVGVLHGQRRQRRRSALAARPVERRQVPPQRHRATSRRRRYGAAAAAARAARLRCGPQRCLGPAPRAGTDAPAAAVRSKAQSRAPPQPSAPQATPPLRPQRSPAQAAPHRPPRSIAAAPQAAPGTACAGSRAAPQGRPAPPQARRGRAARAAAPPARSHSCRRAPPAAALKPLQEPQPPLRIRQRDLGRPRLRQQRRPHHAAPPTTAAPTAPIRSAPRTGCGSKPRHPAPRGSG